MIAENLSYFHYFFFALYTYLFWQYENGENRKWRLVSCNKSNKCKKGFLLYQKLKYMHFSLVQLTKPSFSTWSTNHLGVCVLIIHTSTFLFLQDLHIIYHGDFNIWFNGISNIETRKLSRTIKKFGLQTCGLNKNEFHR